VTAGSAVWSALRAAGVDAVFGAALPGVPAVVAPPGAAAVLARAHERVHRAPAAVSTPGSLVFGTGAATAVDDVAELPAALAGAVARRGRLDLRVDPGEPARAGVPALPPPPVPDLLPWLDRLAAARRPVVLAGPGVITARAVPGLHALATAGGLGVLNTWGAKGVLPWQSVHHWATVGLQRDDFVLGGLAVTDLVVAVGLDPWEAPDERWRLADALEVPPAALGPLAERLRADGSAADHPVLRARLAEVTQRSWRITAAPLPPSAVTRAYGEVVAGRGGLVAADAGSAGFWVARTLGTTVLDSVVVPGPPEEEGFAVACALVARLRAPARPVLAVTGGPPGPRTVELLDLAEGLGRPVPVEVWDADGPRLDATAHAARLAGAVHAERTSVLPLATDGRQLDEMVEAAGPVVAWT
jgi:hypothetical protein